MSSSLSLSFNDFTFSPITRDNQPWFKSSEIARALGYKREDFLSKLYRKNADEFTPDMTQVIENLAERRNGVLGNLSEGRARIFSLRGCHLLAMFARTPVAKSFRRWVLDVIEQYGDKVPVSEPVTIHDTTSATITAAEQAQLHAIVDAKVGMLPKAERARAYKAIWTRHNRHFQIAKYQQLPSVRLAESIDYLVSLDVNQKAIISQTSEYTDKFRAFVELEERFVQFSGETRRKMSELNSEYIRLSRGNTAAMLGMLPTMNPASMDRIIDSIAGQSYDAYTWLDEGLSRMRLAIVTARAVSNVLAG